MCASDRILLHALVYDVGFPVGCVGSPAGLEDFVHWKNCNRTFLKKIIIIILISALCFALSAKVEYCPIISAAPASVYIHRGISTPAKGRNHLIEGDEARKFAKNRCDKMRFFAGGCWSMSLALSFLAIAAVQAVANPAARDFRGFGRISSSPWGFERNAVASLTRLTLNIRGGGLFGTQKSAARIYKQSLEEQVLLLNEQLAHARIEVSTLRENAKQRHKAGRSPRRAENNQTKQEQKLERQRQAEQKEALARLQNEINTLEKMKAELEKMLETSATKIELLEEQLTTQESLTAKMEASFKDKIAKLEQQLEKVQTAQLEKLTEIHQQKIDAAVQDALRAQEAEFRAKIEETTQRLSKEHAKEMEQEKLRSSKAVETERKKMRKLVRALALREKKLKLQSPESAKEESTKQKTVVNTTSSSSQKKQFTPPTSRGTI